MGYALSTTVERSFDDTLEATRAALSDAGFGVLTEIDVQATLKAKLDADVPPQVILGACRPALALAALQLEPSIGVLLPCSVAVRAMGEPAPPSRPLTPQPWSSSPATTPWQPSQPTLGPGSPQHFRSSRRRGPEPAGTGPAYSGPPNQPARSRTLHGHPGASPARRASTRKTAQPWSVSFSRWPEPPQITPLHRQPGVHLLHCAVSAPAVGWPGCAGDHRCRAGR